MLNAIFSQNKRNVTVDRCNLNEKTINALRFVKKSKILAGGSALDIHLTNDLLISARFAYSRYKAHLEDVKRTEEEKTKHKEKAATKKRELEESSKLKKQQ